MAGIYQTFSSSSRINLSGQRVVLHVGGDTLLGADCALLGFKSSFSVRDTNLLALYKSDNFSASVGTDTWFQYQVTMLAI